MSFSPDEETVVLSTYVKPGLDRQQRRYPAEIGSCSRTHAPGESFAVVFEQPSVERADKKLGLGGNQNRNVCCFRFDKRVAGKRSAVKRQEPGVAGTNEQTITKNRQRGQVVVRQSIQRCVSAFDIAGVVNRNEPA